MKNGNSTVSRALSGRRRPKVRREREVEVIRHFRTVIRSIQAHSIWVERQCGVSAAQLWALWEIHSEPGLRVKDISERLSIKPATASNLLDKVQAKGLIRRDRCGPDQRVVQLFITPAGEQLLADAPGPAEGALLNALARMNDRELQDLGSSLFTLVDSMTVREQEFAMAPIPTDDPDDASRRA
ncbi:MAG: MarR family transcriptional regulator [Wenzhouxiangella sp.]|nr:MAG: MarR family transcriptional regulator [Wenzhouxiangella sp.]